VCSETSESTRQPAKTAGDERHLGGVLRSVRGRWICGRCRRRSYYARILMNGGRGLHLYSSPACIHCRSFDVVEECEDETT